MSSLDELAALEASLAPPARVAPGIERLSVRTPTLPPATRTNVYAVGGPGGWTVFDPASPWDDEQARTKAWLDGLEGRVERIVLTHHHHDHVAGAARLRDQLAAEGLQVPVCAHPITAELVAADLKVDAHLHHDEVLACGARELRAVFTPGHAPGHLVFLDDDSGAVVAGDLVAGVGTILIAPHDGDLGLYLDSLERVRALEPSQLLPSHGPVLEQADAVLGFYVAHRHQRTEQIRAALDDVGEASAEILAPRVYPDLPELALGMAAVQIESHLRWLGQQGMAERTSDMGWRLVR